MKNDTDPGQQRPPAWALSLTLGLLSIQLLAPAAAQGAELDLPPYPYWDNPVFGINEAHLSALSAQSCAADPALSSVDFVIGPLAYTAFDALCEAEGEALEALLGDLYLSGYFGGIWLRDALIPEARRLPGAAPSAALPIPLPPFAAPSDWDAARRGEAALFAAVTAAAGLPIRRAIQGGPAEVLLANKIALPALAAMYGYNLGYIQVILDNPPAGSDIPPDALLCGDHLLDCWSPEIPLAILDVYAPALAKLSEPPSVRWQRLDDEIQAAGIPAIASGAAVWEDILAEDDIAGEAFGPLIDASVGFLMVTEAVTLAAATGLAEGEVDAGRCALKLQGGLALWSGAYFMGLASDAPEGTFPTLTCP